MLGKYFMVYGGQIVKKQKCIFIIIFSLLCYDGCGGDQYTSFKMYEITVSKCMCLFTFSTFCPAGRLKSLTGQFWPPDFMFDTLTLHVIVQ